MFITTTIMAKTIQETFKQSWKERQMTDVHVLKDLCELIVDCEHKTAPTQRVGYPSIRTPNIGRGRFLLDGVNRVSEETYREWTRRAIPKNNDLILAREAPVGNVAIIKNGMKVCLGQRTVLIRPDKKKIDPHYLTYLLLGDEVQAKFRGYSGGATVAHLNVKDIRNLTLPPLPSPETQCKIASILSTYDDLIENNKRRIVILEEIARRMFEEWFIKFRFPGHEEVRKVESELGDIPEGWHIKNASDAMYINPQTKVPKTGEKPFVPMGCLLEDSMLILNTETREGNSGSKFQNGDTLFARITPCLENGKTGYVQFLPPDQAVAFGSTEFIVLRSKTLSPEIVYLMARSSAFRDNAIKSMSGASGRQRVREACFDTFRFPHPGQEIIAKFSNMVRPMFGLIHSLSKKNANLQATRDFLLPILISGEIDVSDTADVTEKAAAL